MKVDGPAIDVVFPLTAYDISVVNQDGLRRAIEGQWVQLR